MDKDDFAINIKRFFSHFTWYEIVFSLISIFTVLGLSIYAKSSALTILYSFFAVLYVLLLMKKFKISIIFGIIQSVLYIIQSGLYNNWGEFIINIAVILPILILTLINWEKDKNIEEITVKSRKVSLKSWIIILILSLCVGIVFFFVLRYFNTPYLILASLSGFFATFANCIMLKKSPFMFVFYSFANIISFLIWLLPIINGVETNFETIPMAATLCVFALSNVFGLINWFKRDKSTDDKKEILQQNIEEKE